MADQIQETLSYDDVLLVPQYSPIRSRHHVSTKTKITKSIELSIPIVSSNMDTITEHKMAIAMARLGGVGIIHRFLSPHQQAIEVQKVKRAESLVIENPYSVQVNNSWQEIKDLRRQYNVSSFLVVDSNNKLIGILTRRDTLFEDGNNPTVREMMTPKEQLITAQKNITIEKAEKLLHKNRIEKLPLVDKDGVLVGLITTTDIEKRNKFPLAVKDKKGRLVVGAAIGVKDGCLERAEALVAAGADFLVIDIAHGHSVAALDTIKLIRKHLPNIDLIGGNVATADGALALIKAGVDGVKVGVGPASICITRLVTGSGVPQLSAVQDCVRIATKHHIPVIADGGIKRSGDIVKAVAAGADTVMLGNLLSGTEETPGKVLHKDGKQFKIYRGMASFGATSGRAESEKGEWQEDAIDGLVPEGVESLMPYRGPVQNIIEQLVGGFRSGMTYSGAKTIEEFHEKAEFIKITAGGRRESSHHDVIKL